MKKSLERGLRVYIENDGLSLNILHKEAQLLCFIGIAFSSISPNMQASPWAVHKSRHPASVIPFMRQSFVPSTKAYSIYHYSFQFPQTPIACHLNGLPDRR